MQFIQFKLNKIKIFGWGQANFMEPKSKTVQMGNMGNYQNNYTTYVELMNPAKFDPCSRSS